MFAFLDVMYIIFNMKHTIHYNQPMDSSENQMPYREKVAWLSLIAMVVTMGPYFLIFARAHFGDEVPNFRQLGLYGAAAVVQMIILGIGHLYLRSTAPQEASMPPDERDLAISRHATSTAYYALLVGMIVVGIVMPFTSHGWSIINAAILTIVAAEVVHQGVIALSYHWQK